MRFIMKSLTDCMVRADATMAEVVEGIDRGAVQIALVVNENESLAEP